MKGKTNPKGPGTETIGINMPKTRADELRRLATKSDMSLSAYCKRILFQAAANETIFQITESSIAKHGSTPERGSKVA